MKKKDFIVHDLLSKIYQFTFEDLKLPTERSLATQYNVSRHTVHEALKRLKNIGIIKVVQGSGIFIKKNIRNNPLIYNSLTENPYENIKSKVIYLEKELATQEDQQVFGLVGTDEVWVFQRIRIVNYQIVQVETSRMPKKLFAHLTLEDVEQSIQSYVKAQKYKISHYLTTYEPLSIDKKLAELLMQKKGTAAMKIINRGILSNGSIFEMSEIIALDYKCTYITPFNEEQHRSDRKSVV